MGASLRGGWLRRSSPRAGHGRRRGRHRPGPRCWRARTTCGSTAAPSPSEPREVWAVNKPAGVVSTAREPGEPAAPWSSLVRSEARLYPVGRLDADSTGLLLLTNDGELANRLTHPRYEVPKAYRAELRRPPSEADLRRLASGVELEDGLDRAGQGAPPRRARDRDRPARGAQPPGPPHGRGGGQQGGRPAPRPLRPDRARRASPRARRAASPRKRSPGSGKMPNREHELRNSDSSRCGARRRRTPTRPRRSSPRPRS